MQIDGSGILFMTTSSNSKTHRITSTLFQSSPNTCSPLCIKQHSPLLFSLMTLVFRNNLIKKRKIRKDILAEWSKACDSKSLLRRRRRFKSCRCRFLVKKSKELEIGNWCQSKSKKKRISFLFFFSLLFVFVFVVFTGFLCAFFLPAFLVFCSFFATTHSLCFCQNDRVFSFP